MTALLSPTLGPRTTSRPGAFVRVQHYPDGTVIRVAPRPDPIGKIGRAFRQLGTALSAMVVPAFAAAARQAAEMERVMAQINAAMRVPQWLRDQANALPRVAGLEARYFIRASMDPAYAAPEALAQLVQRLIAGDEEYEPDLAFVTRENRIAVAVSAMRGWEQRGTPPWRHPEEPPLIAHRLWGTARVEVRCG